jgi:hypothetical protein
MIADFIGRRLRFSFAYRFQARVPEEPLSTLKCADGFSNLSTWQVEE